MNIDIRTPTEIARDDKHRKICSDYLELSKEMPDCKPNRIFTIIAKNYCMSIMGISKIVKKYGLYKPE